MKAVQVEKDEKNLHIGFNVTDKNNYTEKLITHLLLHRLAFLGSLEHFFSLHVFFLYYILVSISKQCFHLFKSTRDKQ